MCIFELVVDLVVVVGEKVGQSDWVIIIQEEVNLFVDVMGDYQWIYVDLEWVVVGFFGIIIVYGFMILVLFLCL